ncbi:MULTISPECIES: hypothetical protein [Paenarthrobacter]|jgi:hypothetical protein|uniref:hypothetical protein n=1 Tax=Paenarthrobacter TaxID=1742992 RepID=UPI0023659447|nr:hypothetical protein [Paenarthrobacter sp. AB444]MDD7835010.1 hypothetical protein [Paenarthrobacter sp. AB444]
MPASKDTKLKTVRNGDRLRIGGEVFEVSAVEPQTDTHNIRLELQGHDGGLVTLIGLPKTRVELAAKT